MQACICTHAHARTALLVSAESTPDPGSASFCSRHMSIHMPIHMSIHLSMHVSLHMSIHMSICTSVHMSVYASFFARVDRHIYTIFQHTRRYTGRHIFLYTCQFMRARLRRYACLHANTHVRPVDMSAYMFTHTSISMSMHMFTRISSKCAACLFMCLYPCPCTYLPICLHIYLLKCLRTDAYAAVYIVLAYIVMVCILMAYKVCPA